jgi:hypothetical protein
LVPAPEEQIRFLINLQRLLSEGLFVATYKYALLLALADIAVESGGDDDGPHEISTRRIAEKFICYYWRQCSPYMSLRGGAKPMTVLRQKTPGGRLPLSLRLRRHGRALRALW